MKKTFNLNFMKASKVFIVIGALIILSGLSLLLVRGLNLGIDFTGGNILRVTFVKDVEVSAVRQALANAGHQSAQVQRSGEKGMLIRDQVHSELAGDLRNEMIATLRTVDPDVKMDSFELIGPTVGGELSRQATYATLLAMACILVYIAYRFQFRFAVVSVVALFHDVMFMLAVFCILQREISMPFIAAILTTVGYSLNDSIVILDRVRENWGQRQKLGYAQLFNDSINQTLGRTLNTKITTLLSILAFYIWGGPVLANFSLAIILGILAGAFSSMCLVCSLLLVWYKKVPERH